MLRKRLAMFMSVAMIVTMIPTTPAFALEGTPVEEKQVQEFSEDLSSEPVVTENFSDFNSGEEEKKINADKGAEIKQVSEDAVNDEPEENKNTIEVSEDDVEADEAEYPGRTHVASDSFVVKGQDGKKIVTISIKDGDFAVPVDGEKLTMKASIIKNGNDLDAINEVLEGERPEDKSRVTYNFDICFMTANGIEAKLLNPASLKFEFADEVVSEDVKVFHVTDEELEGQKEEKEELVEEAPAETPAAEEAVEEVIEETPASEETPAAEETPAETPAEEVQQLNAEEVKAEVVEPAVVEAEATGFSSYVVDFYLEDLTATFPIMTKNLGSGETAEVSINELLTRTNPGQYMLSNVNVGSISVAIFDTHNPGESQIGSGKPFNITPAGAITKASKITYKGDYNTDKDKVFHVDITSTGGTANLDLDIFVKFAAHAEDMVSLLNLTVGNQHVGSEKYLYGREDGDWEYIPGTDSNAPQNGGTLIIHPQDGQLDDVYSYNLRNADYDADYLMYNPAPISVNAIISQIDGVDLDCDGSSSADTATPYAYMPVTRLGASAHKTATVSYVTATPTSANSAKGLIHYDGDGNFTEVEYVGETVENLTIIIATSTTITAPDASTRSDDVLKNGLNSDSFGIYAMGTKGLHIKGAEDLKIVTGKTKNRSESSNQMLYLKDYSGSYTHSYNSDANTKTHNTSGKFFNENKYMAGGIFYTESGDYSRHNTSGKFTIDSTETGKLFNLNIETASPSSNNVARNYSGILSSQDLVIKDVQISMDLHVNDANDVYGINTGTQFENNGSANLENSTTGKPNLTMSIVAETANTVYGISNCYNDRTWGITRFTKIRNENVKVSGGGVVACNLDFMHNVSGDNIFEDVYAKSSVNNINVKAVAVDTAAWINSGKGIYIYRVEALASGNNATATAYGVEGNITSVQDFGGSVHIGNDLASIDSSKSKQGFGVYAHSDRGNAFAAGAYCAKNHKDRTSSGERNPGFTINSIGTNYHMTLDIQNVKATAEANDKTATASGIYFTRNADNNEEISLTGCTNDAVVIRKISAVSKKNSEAYGIWSNRQLNVGTSSSAGNELLKIDDIYAKADATNNISANAVANGIKVPTLVVKNAKVKVGYAPTSGWITEDATSSGASIVAVAKGAGTGGYTAQTNATGIHVDTASVSDAAGINVKGYYAKSLRSTAPTASMSNPDCAESYGIFAEQKFAIDGSSTKVQVDETSADSAVVDVTDTPNEKIKSFAVSGAVKVGKASMLEADTALLTVSGGATLTANGSDINLKTYKGDSHSPADAFTFGIFAGGVNESESKGSVGIYVTGNSNVTAEPGEIKFNGTSAVLKQAGTYINGNSVISDVIGTPSAADLATRSSLYVDGGSTFTSNGAAINNENELSAGIFIASQKDSRIIAKGASKICANGGDSLYQSGYKQNSKSYGIYTANKDEYSIGSDYWDEDMDMYGILVYDTAQIKAISGLANEEYGIKAPKTSVYVDGDGQSSLPTFIDGTHIANETNANIYAIAKDAKEGDVKNNASKRYGINASAYINYGGLVVANVENPLNKTSGFEHGQLTGHEGYHWDGLSISGPMYLCGDAYTSAYAPYLTNEKSHAIHLGGSDSVYIGNDAVIEAYNENRDIDENKEPRVYPTEGHAFDTKYYRDWSCIDQYNPKITWAKAYEDVHQSIDNPNQEDRITEYPYVKIERVQQYDVFVGNIRFNSTNKDGKQVFNGQTGNVKYDPWTNTLTFNDFTYEGVGNGAIRNQTGAISAGIYSMVYRKPLTIILNGENHINVNGANDGGVVYGIYAPDDIIIKKGTASDPVSSSSHALYIDTSNVVGAPNLPYKSIGIYPDAFGGEKHSVKIEDAYVDVKTGAVDKINDKPTPVSSGIFTENSVFINNSTVNIDTKGGDLETYSYGILAYNALTATNSNIDVSVGTSGKATTDGQVKGLVSENKSIILENTNLKVITAEGNSKNIAVSTPRMFIDRNAGVLDVHCGAMNMLSDITGLEYASIGIDAPEGVLIDNVSSVRVITDDNEGATNAAIYTRGTATISDVRVLDIEAGSAGFNKHKDSYGVLASKCIIITGTGSDATATVSAAKASNGKDSYALKASHCVDISGFDTFNFGVNVIKQGGEVEYGEGKTAGIYVDGLIGENPHVKISTVNELNGNLDNSQNKFDYGIYSNGNVKFTDVGLIDIEAVGGKTKAYGIYAEKDVLSTVSEASPSELSTGIKITICGQSDSYGIYAKDYVDLFSIRNLDIKNESINWNSITGIYSEGRVTIEGTGEGTAAILNGYNNSANAKACGILADSGNVTISDFDTFKINSQKAMAGDVGISAKAGDVIANNVDFVIALGTNGLTAGTKLFGIKAGDNIKSEGCSFDITLGNATDDATASVVHGLYAWQNVKATASTASPADAPYDITIKHASGQIVSTGIKAAKGDVELIGIGNLDIEETGNGIGKQSYGIKAANGTVTIEGTDGTATISNANNAIENYGILAKEVKASAFDKFSITNGTAKNNNFGIFASTGNITIKDIDFDIDLAGNEITNGESNSYIEGISAYNGGDIYAEGCGFDITLGDVKSASASTATVYGLYANNITATGSNGINIAVATQNELASGSDVTVTGIQAISGDVKIFGDDDIDIAIGSAAAPNVQSVLIGIRSAKGVTIDSANIDIVLGNATGVKGILSKYSIDIEGQGTSKMTIIAGDADTEVRGIETEYSDVKIESFKNIDINVGSGLSSYGIYAGSEVSINGCDTAESLITVATANDAAGISASNVKIDTFSKFKIDVEGTDKTGNRYGIIVRPQAPQAPLAEQEHLLRGDRSKLLVKDVDIFRVIIVNGKDIAAIYSDGDVIFTAATPSAADIRTGKASNSNAGIHAVNDIVITNYDISSLAGTAGNTSNGVDADNVTISSGSQLDAIAKTASESNGIKADGKITVDSKNDAKFALCAFGEDYGINIADNQLELISGKVMAVDDGSIDGGSLTASASDLKSEKYIVRYATDLGNDYKLLVPQCKYEDVNKATACNGKYYWEQPVAVFEKGAWIEYVPGNKPDTGVEIKQRTGKIEDYMYDVFAYDSIDADKVGTFTPNPVAFETPGKQYIQMGWTEKGNAGTLKTAMTATSSNYNDYLDAAKGNGELYQVVKDDPKYTELKWNEIATASVSGVNYGATIKMYPYWNHYVEITLAKSKTETSPEVAKLYEGESIADFVKKIQNKLSDLKSKAGKYETYDGMFDADDNMFIGSNNTVSGDALAKRYGDAVNTYQPTATSSDLTLTAKYTYHSGGGSGSGGSSKSPEQPAGSVTGNWVYHPSIDKWTFTSLDNTHLYRSEWAYIYNPYATGNQSKVSWFYFDANGYMLTGWHWIRSEITGKIYCYYFHEVSDNCLGMLHTNTIIDGQYEVNADGHWVINGVEQTR